jgi:ABC-2 type transport system permease protein
MKLPLVNARFVFRQMRRGIVLFVIALSLLATLQSVGLQASMPDPIERKKLVTALGTNPTINLLYGETTLTYTPAGYMYYRAGVMCMLIASLWGLMFATRMFRGHEEDGRTELLLTGSTTQGRHTVETLLGIFSGITVAFLLLLVVVSLIGSQDYVGLDIGESAYFTFAMVINVAFFAAVGAFTSQLVETRRKAILFGAIPLAILFVMRSIGNVADSLYWLKNYTPFGWVDQMHPIYNHQPLWVIPFLITIPLLCIASIWLASNRDLGDSLLRAKEYAKPKFALLRSPLGMSFRLTRGILLSWLIGTIAMGIMIASVAQTAADALMDSGDGELTQTIQALSQGGLDIAASFVAVGSMFTALLIMAMIAWGIGSIRSEEAKQLLENFVVRKVSRTKWLMGRVFILAVASLVTCVVTSIAVWYTAKAQGIDVDLKTMVVDGLNILAPVTVVLGLGVAIFGVLPRIATWVLYALLGWSFVAQMIAAIVKDQTTSDILNSTSILQPMSLVPVATVDWIQFWQVTACGIALLIVGFYAFSRRDLQSE